MTDLDLRDLDAFVAVARTRNFHHAAREQCVSASSRSRRLRDMEERLGVRLMHRTTCSVGLTEAGELLLARVGPAITDIGGARAGSGAGPVRCAVGAIADQCAAAGDRSGAGADGCAVPENRSEDRSGNRCRELVG
jgi:DNA-binding transcriptional LysR family regulator